ncbi:hypothetical protein M501DRAFT_866592 [Patellaria atrata CBS 101060]|uniref:Uncharacterized protein n=1 Tax=Patellaria atrata CBS 101060 TaxID=1346257 RepID=A0A9P4S931_9PEZI|nr:hypothetical protein M501DRAFT_866592 [Patellaria atrata CBS 101060]
MVVLFFNQFYALLMTTLTNIKKFVFKGKFARYLRDFWSLAQIKKASHEDFALKRLIDVGIPLDPQEEFLHCQRAIPGWNGQRHWVDYVLDKVELVLNAKRNKLDFSLRSEQNMFYSIVGVVIPIPGYLCKRIRTRYILRIYLYAVISSVEDQVNPYPILSSLSSCTEHMSQW